MQPCYGENLKCAPNILCPNLVICVLNVDICLIMKQSSANLWAFIAKSLENVLPKFRNWSAFDGNILNWRSFWERFCVSVRNCSNLLDSEKLVYFQPSLKDGPMKNVVEGLSMAWVYTEAIEYVLKPLRHLFLITEDCHKMKLPRWGRILHLANLWHPLSLW